MPFTRWWDGCRCTKPTLNIKSCYWFLMLISTGVFITSLILSWIWWPRPASEVHHDTSKADIGLLAGWTFVASFLMSGACLICCIGISTTACKLTTGCPKNDDDDDIYVMEAPPPKTASSPVMAPDVSSVVKQKQSVSEDACYNRVPSPGDELQGNRTKWNVEMNKKIDSHNGSLRFIQAISDKMEDIKDQVKAITAAFDESIISKGYDFFIIYCGKNSAIADGIIMPHLADLKITYCEHQQHFIPGRNIFTNIQDCITQSRKVLAVFSADFFASEWCRKDLDMALVHATEKQIENFIVPIKIDDCVIPSQYGDLKNITYSDLTISPNDWSAWEQIRCSLASICVASMEIEIRMCPEHLQKPSNSSTANTWL